MTEIQEDRKVRVGERYLTKKCQIVLLVREVTLFAVGKTKALDPKSFIDNPLLEGDDGLLYTSGGIAFTLSTAGEVRPFVTSSNDDLVYRIDEVVKEV